MCSTRRSRRQGPSGLDRKSTRLNSRHPNTPYSVFFFNDRATTEIYPLSLHDALPICIVRDCMELSGHGIGSIAIMANAPAEYPEDSFENMKRVAAEFGYPFPYVLDKTQQAARAFGAVCTPDFFGYNAALELQYRGRLDASKREPVPDAPRELYDAMVQIARTGRGPSSQTPSIGCSIKLTRS